MDNYLQKIFQESNYEMSNQSLSSSGSSFSFEDIEKQPLIDLPEAELLPIFSSILIKKELKYFQLVSQNIEAQKRKFLSDYEKAKSKIDQLFTYFAELLKDRQETLEKELLNKVEKKIDLWNHQMSTLQFIQNYLRYLNITNRRTNQDTLKKLVGGLMRDLEFIDPSGIQFDVEQEKCISFFKNIGTIIYSDDLRLVIPKFVIGKNGDGPGEFCRPWGVATDPMGHIFICDRSNHRIQVFNDIGEFIFQFGKEGSQPGEFNRPAGIAINKKNHVLVCDKDNHRIQIFTFSGNFITNFGSKGTDVGQFMYPWGIAVNENCDIAVSDSKNHRVQLFNEFGVLINVFDVKKLKIERPRSHLKVLDSPRGLAFRPDGSLLLTDFNNHRILIISKNFDRFMSLGREGSEPGQFFRPQGITSDYLGRFAVADCKNYRIQVFDENNSLIKIFGSQGNSPGQFDCPQGICFHPNGSLVVVDLNNDRIQVF